MEKKGNSYNSQRITHLDRRNNIREDIKSMMLKLQDQVIHHIRLEDKINEEESASVQDTATKISESKLDRLEREIVELRTENEILKKAIETFRKG